MDKARIACFGGLAVIAVLLVWKVVGWLLEVVAFALLLIIATAGTGLEWVAGLPGNIILLIAGGALASFLWVTRDRQKPPPQ